MKTLGKWWVGLRGICANCGEEIEIEDGDQVRPEAHARQPGVSVRCPTCKGTIFVHRPAWR